MKQRIEWVDILKGLTIILVVIVHGTIGIQDSKAGSYLLYPQIISTIRNIIHSFDMPLFFIVAGAFVGHWGDLPIKKAFEKKAWRLGYPYFFWGGITACAMEFASGSINGKLGFHNYLNSWYIPFSEYWFLYIMFFMFVLYYIYNSLHFPAYLHTKLFLSLSLLAFIVNPYIPNVWISRLMFSFWIYFAIGIYIASINLHYKINGNGTHLLGSLIVFLIIEFIYLWQLAGNPHSKNVYYLFFCTSVSGTYFVANLAALISRSKGLIRLYLDFCGKYSMQIYCTHIFFLAGMRMILLKTSLFNYPAIILIVCILTALVATAVFINISQK